MQTAANKIWREAFRLLAFAWRSFVLTDLVYKAIGFALLTPAVVFFLNWMISRTGAGVVADADIASFLFTTRQGIVALLLCGSVVIAITAVESACLMAIAMAAVNGIPLRAKDALAFGARRAGKVLRLTGHMLVRILVGLIPFALAGAAIFFGLLHDHDINFYLARKPTQFWVAMLLLMPVLVALVVLLLRTVARWAFSLPLIVFEEISPREAFPVSASRAAGKHSQILIALSVWAVVGLGLSGTITLMVELIGRAVGPHFSESLFMLLIFIGTLAFVWGVFGLVVAIFNVSLFSTLIVLLYLKFGASDSSSASFSDAGSRGVVRVSRGMVIGVVATVAVLVIGLSLFVFLRSGRNQQVLVIAHRGASIDAPENTLAAFRLAGKERADFVELDVQEASDGTVIVNHDSDLMKIGRSPMKIWEHTAAELRTVDIGSYLNPQFKDERVATLAEALAACKGNSKVLVELKSYGHNKQLEERVAKVVEESGMVNDCVYMSLDHSMSRKMKQIRPSWRVGVLAAKTIGNLTTISADFVAVEARMATRRFVRRAHRANQDVYVWTVDDPAWMLSAMSNGVDGLITNKPALAREVVSRRQEMSQAQRILVALLVRLGASADSLESENALRP